MPTAALAFLLAASFSAESSRATGEAIFTPASDESALPERFRLPAHTFAWQSQRMNTVTETLEVWDVTFPSPITTPEPANNTVHCEYFRSRQPGQRPVVIVLHILGGDFELARLFCNAIAQRGSHALFVKMPYYGPRRPPASTKRMISSDPRETVAGMTQAVLDIRHAAAWLAARPEVDSDQLGIFGISLGGITSSLAAAIEPRLKNVCLLLAGGEIGRIGWDSPHLKKTRDAWLAQGGTREQFLEITRVVDPVTYATRARGKRILMLNADRDEVIPRECTEMLWNALGQPPIHYYSGGHYSAIWHLASALNRVSLFFQMPLTTDK